MSLLTDHDLYLFNEGTHLKLYDRLGSHTRVTDGVEGTNFAVWAFLTGYAKTLSGLITCYAVGLPLFGNTLAGDAFYTAVLFGGYALVKHFVPALRETQSSAQA